MDVLRSHPLFAPLTLDSLDIERSELGADTPQREAKRRRIESNANQYLQGSAPLIQTAALRGPFEIGWHNPWAKEVSARPRRTVTRELAARKIPDHRSGRAPRHGLTAANADSKRRERQARAEAEHVDKERRKAKAERREQRRRELEERERKAAELHGWADPAARPAGLAGASFDTRLTSEALGESRPAAGSAAEEEITRSREYGSREIRSSFTDEWLHRLRSPTKTPDQEPSPAHAYEPARQEDALEALTPTRTSTNRRDLDRNGAIGLPRPAARFLLERQASSSSETNRPRRKDRGRAVHLSSHDDGAAEEDDSAARHPTAAPSSQSAWPQRLQSRKPRADRPREISRRNVRGPDFPRLALAGPGSSSTLQVDPHDEYISRNPTSKQERTVGAQGHLPASTPEAIAPRSPPSRHIKHPSGFTPINQRFSSPAGEALEPAISTTPAGRPALAVRATTNNVNPTELTRVSTHPENGDTLILLAGDIRVDKGPVCILDGSPEGQENTSCGNENKIAGQPPSKKALMPPSDQAMALAVPSFGKRKREHPLHASPTAFNSQGFAYRKVSDSTVNAPRLRPVNPVEVGADTRPTKARKMTFDSFSSQPDAMIEPEEGRPGSRTRGQLPNADERSQGRDLSTQAAILFAQQEFRQEFQSPEKDASTASPGKVTGSQRSGSSRAAPSQSPARYTIITPFKAFNKGKPFLANNPSQLEPGPMSTQELFDGATPVAFSTVKKDRKARKRVSLAVSPLKSADDPVADADAGRDETAAEGETAVPLTTATEVFATTDPQSTTPKFSPLAHLASLGLPKPRSRIPPLPSALKPRRSPHAAATTTTLQQHEHQHQRAMSAQTSSSVFKSAQSSSLPPPPSSSAPAASRALSRVYQRALSQGVGGGHGLGSSPQPQGGWRERRQQLEQAKAPAASAPALEPAALLDDIDLDSAIDAADSFLDSANLGLQGKGMVEGKRRDWGRVNGV